MNKLGVLALALACLLVSLPAPAPVIVGNGGDPRIIKLKNARIEAVNWTYKVSIFPQFLAGDALTPSLVKGLLLGEDVLVTLADDILRSPHLYDTDPQPTCAWTNVPPPAAPSLDHIRLSLPICGPFLTTEGRTYAVKTLIHESMHHLLRSGELKTLFQIEFNGDDQERYDQEEELCNEVALAVERAFDLAAREGVAHWQDISVDHESLDERGLHSAVWTGDRMIVWGGCKDSEQALEGCGTYLKSGGIYDPSADRWTRTDESTAPEARAYHSAVWTGQKMLIWGGCTRGAGCQDYLTTGASFDPARNIWRQTASAATIGLRGRTNHATAWTGTRLLIWGGQTGVNTPGAQAEALGDGGLYDPAADLWTPVATDENTPAPRSFHTATWTGDTGNPATANKMLVWGGCDKEEFVACDRYFGDGAFYDPSTRRWTKLVTTGVAPAARRLHTAVLVPGKAQLIIWGGQAGTHNLGDGAILDLKTLHWQRMLGIGPEARSRHTSVWTGDSMVVFGGETAPGVYAEKVGSFTPPASPAASGVWSDVLGEYYPIKVKNHTALWTGEAMVIWGGQSARREFRNVGAMFFPGILW